MIEKQHKRAFPRKPDVWLPFTFGRCPKLKDVLVLCDRHLRMKKRLFGHGTPIRMRPEWLRVVLAQQPLSEHFTETMPST